MVDSKQKIINAAEALFALKGYDGVSVVEIALKAKTSKSLIFHYFKSKENILIDLIKKRLEEFEDFLKGSLKHHTPRKKLESFIESYLNLLTRQTDFFKILFRETLNSNRKITNLIIQHNTRVADIIREIIEEGKELGDFRSDINTESYSILLTTLLNSTAAIKALQSLKPEPFQLNFDNLKTEIRKLMVEGVLSNAEKNC